MLLIFPRALTASMRTPLFKSLKASTRGSTALISLRFPKTLIASVRTPASLSFRTPISASVALGSLILPRACTASLRALISPSLRARIWSSMDASTVCPCTRAVRMSDEISMRFSKSLILRFLPPQTFKNISIAWLFFPRALSACILLTSGAFHLGSTSKAFS